MLYIIEAEPDFDEVDCEGRTCIGNDRLLYLYKEQGLTVFEAMSSERTKGVRRYGHGFSLRDDR